MAHYLFNFSDGGREQAAAFLDAKMWGIDDERRDELAPGDVTLIYVANVGAFIGRAEVATAFHEWTPSEAAAYPGDARGGVLLADIERWDPAVPMESAVARIDPTASNPIVQANVATGFRRSVVRITSDEFEATLALSREARET